MPDSAGHSDSLRLDEQQEAESRAIWRSRSEAERMEELERLRMTFYGYDPTTARCRSSATLIKGSLTEQIASR
jgi:hypothetical protein